MSTTQSVKASTHRFPTAAVYIDAFSESKQAEREREKKKQPSEFTASSLNTAYTKAIYRSPGRSASGLHRRMEGNAQISGSPFVMSQGLWPSQCVVFVPLLAKWSSRQTLGINTDSFCCLFCSIIKPLMCYGSKTKYEKRKKKK